MGNSAAVGQPERSQAGRLWDWALEQVWDPLGGGRVDATVLLVPSQEHSVLASSTCWVWGVGRLRIDLGPLGCKSCSVCCL